MSPSIHCIVLDVHTRNTSCCAVAWQVVLLHEEGKRGSLLATSIMEHAGSLVSLAGAYYVQKRYMDAADAYSKSLAVFEMIEDTEKVCKCLVNLANLFELQVGLVVVLVEWT